MRRENNGYRLPVMVEREYAARGGDPDDAAWRFWYAGSNNADDVAWYYGTSGNGVGPEHADWGLHPVGQKASNTLDIYDLSGNVMEWGWDWMFYAANSKAPPMGDINHDERLDPATPLEGPARSGKFRQKPFQGGSWHASSPYALNVTWWGHTPEYRDDKIGFRTVRSW
jgi:formylglycine-generating enzyme required for sulfatase activity